MNINEKISKLDMNKRRMFDLLLMDNLYEREWCRINKIDYVNPNIQTAKEKTYQKMYGKQKEKQSYIFLSLWERTIKRNGIG